MPLMKVPHVRQHDEHLCGPAVAAMIVQTMNGPFAGSVLAAVNQLWSDVKTATIGPMLCTTPDELSDPTFTTAQSGLCINGTPKCWATTPQALEAVLNLNLGAVQVSALRLAHNQLPAALAAVFDSVDAGLPTAVLVYSGHHWIVVNGYSQAKGGRRVGNRQIRYVGINDPQENMGTRVAIGAFETMFVKTDCGIQHPPHFEDHEKLIAIVEQQVGRNIMADSAEPPAPPPTGPDLPPESILRIAADEADAILVDDQDPAWRLAFEVARPARAVFVQRYDDDGPSHYIVTFELPDRSVLARMAINARTGAPLAVEAIEEPGEVLEAWAAPPAGAKGPFWRPSNQTPSPLLPFYVLGDGDSPSFVRTDGKRFTRLTNLPGR